MWEVGPQLAAFFPGLPDLRQLSPVDITAYLLWRAEALTQRNDESEA